MHLTIEETFDNWNLIWNVCIVTWLGTVHNIQNGYSANLKMNLKMNWKVWTHILCKLEGNMSEL